MEEIFAVACGCDGGDIDIEISIPHFSYFYLPHFCIFDSLEDFSNSARRGYAGHAVIKYLVANFQRRARGQGVSPPRSIHIPKASYGCRNTAICAKTCYCKIRSFCVPGCAGFLKRLSGYIFSEVTSPIGAFTNKFCFKKFPNLLLAPALSNRNLLRYLENSDFAQN